jgi:kinesin family protein 20
MPRASATYAFGSSMSLAAMANGGGGVLKRRVLQLKPDPEGNGKYISGVNEVRVRTREVSVASTVAASTAA